MVKKLTITVSDEVDEGLHRHIGKRKISSLISGLAAAHLSEHSAERWLSASPEELDRAYAEQAAYEASPEFAEERRDSKDWLDNLIGDAFDDVGSDQTR